MARKTKAEAAETRLKILDVAEILFFERGVSQTSLEQIAEAAGVTRGAIYWHFSNKVDLFRALHERVRLPQENIVERAAVEGHPDPLGLLEQVALDCLKIITTDARQQRVSTILLLRCEYVGEMAYALKRQQDADAVMRENLLRIFTMARNNNSLSGAWTPAIAAKVFESMMRGLWADWLRFGQSFDLLTIGSQCITELFRSFRAPSTPNFFGRLSASARAPKGANSAGPQSIRRSGHPANAGRHRCSGTRQSNRQKPVPSQKWS